MRAVTVVADDRVEVHEQPNPAPMATEVLVRVAGAGINRADLLQRAGLYPAPPGSPPDVPGLEFAGTIEAVAPGVTSVAEGESVVGICGGGAQAELVTVPAEQCARLPKHIDIVAAGGIGETFVTAHDALVTQAGLAAGDWVCIHAVGSGVGTSAIQLARAMGARVVGTARSADKLERARALGLEAGIVPPTDADGAVDPRSLGEAIFAATEGHGINIALDLVGGAYVEADIQAAAPHGRIVLVGTLAGGNARLNVLTAMQRRLRILGTVLRTRSTAEKSAAVAAFARDVLPQIASGKIEPVVERVLPLASANEAYDLVATNTTFGKVILTP